MPEPRYRAIADDLAAKIRAGGYRPGAALPPQRELSAAYGVTLMTLRQALQMLSDEGLVDQQPGRGTFVAPPQVAYRLDTLRSLSQDLREQGHEVRTEVLRSGYARSPAAISTVLGSGRALRLVRLRRVDGMAAVHQISWVAEPGASAIRRADLAETPLYEALAGAGHAVHRAAESIGIGALPAALAPMLGEEPGAAVFTSERITYDLAGRAFVVDHAVISGRMRLRTERAATRMTASWAAPPPSSI